VQRCQEADTVTKTFYGGGSRDRKGEEELQNLRWEDKIVFDFGVF